MQMFAIFDTFHFRSQFIDFIEWSQKYIKFAIYL